MSDSLLLDAARRLAAAGIDNPRLDARVLWNHAQAHFPSLEKGGSDCRRQSGEGSCRQPPPDPASPDRPPPFRGRKNENDLLRFFQSFISRRAAREPLAYIVGKKEFWSLDFEVGPGVLIPRPETETVIEQALAFFPDRTAPLEVLDLGAGTGCLPVAFLKEFVNARGLGVDASEEARVYAFRNVARHGLAGRCEIRGGDWAEAITGSYDVILSNPPYIKTADLAGLEPEVAYEPILALDGGQDGLAAYRALAPELARLLRPEGRVFVEIGAGQGEEVAAFLARSGLETAHIATDLAGIPRVLVAGQKR